MTPAVTIDCMYSCDLCGIVRAHVEVPARDSEQGVRDWFYLVLTPALCADHASRSPYCRPEKLSEVYIPTTGAEFIGGPCVS